MEGAAGWTHVSFNESRYGAWHFISFHFIQTFTTNRGTTATCWQNVFKEKNKARQGHRERVLFYLKLRYFGCCCCCCCYYGRRKPIMDPKKQNADDASVVMVITHTRERERRVTFTARRIWQKKKKRRAEK